MTGPIPVIDTHVHLGPPKYQGREEFLGAMNAEKLDAAVLVQHMGNFDNTYLAQTRSADPARFAAIAIVERAADVDPVIAAGFLGLRLAPGGLPGADGGAVFDALDPHAAVVSVTGPFDDVATAQFRQTVRAHPRLHFRVEHVGGFRYGISAEDKERFGQLLLLADEPNVTLMWSGFWLNAGSQFPYQNTHNYLGETLAAFGSDRIMWSGDWNRPGLGPDDYQHDIELVGLVVPDQDRQADILHRTGARVFGLLAPAAGA
jgi:L-fuconolactonase